MVDNTRELAGQVALITGAGVHTGSTIARTLAAAGAAVAINYRNAKEGALEAVAAIEKAGGKAVAIQGDVTSEDEVKRLVSDTVRQLGKLTILVNNATKRSHCSLDDLTFKEWRDTLATTLDGTFLCTKYAVPHIRQAGGGTIVNIGGGSGHEGRANRAHVSAAKAGVAGMTAALAVELAPQNITVNCIVPGKIETIVDAHLFDAKRRAAVPTGRPARQSEIAALVRFLCGDTCRQLTGQMLHVNGATRTTIA